MRIAVLIEGDTEKAFLPVLRRFLMGPLAGRMPKLDPVPYNGRLPKEDKLRREVERLLADKKQPAEAVIALTDVYTGGSDFADAADAKSKMRQWVGSQSRFYPHAAQYEFEAWLLPYWEEIRRLAGHNRAAPGSNPETVNHGNPPSRRLKEVFRTGSRRGDYVKGRDATRILRDQDLVVAINACAELKSLVNTILQLCGGHTIA